MKSKLKQLGKDSLIYGLGGVLARGLTFFLLPIYTRIFTPVEYGVLEMLTVIATCLGPLIFMGMEVAQIFYFYEQKAEGRAAQARVVTATLQWLLTWGIALVALAFALWSPLNRFFFQAQLSWLYFALSFAGIFGAQLLSQSCEIFRLLYRPIPYICLNLGQTLLSTAVSLLLILEFGLGILGFLWGTLIGAFVLTLISWWQIRQYLDWSRWHLDWWPRLLKFGAPMVPGGLAWYALNNSDRWFISHFVGLQALGLYAVGAKFAVFIALAVQTLRLAWWPVAMDAMHSPDGPGLYRTICRLYLGGGASAVVLLTALSPYLLSWFTAPAYREAYPFVGLLALYPFFHGFYMIGASGIWKAEKTIWYPILLGAAALLNLGLDFWLVPRYGGYGAAAAAITSLAACNLAALIVSEHLWRVGYDYLILSLQVVIGVGGCAGILALYRQDAPSWVIWGATLVIMGVLLALAVTNELLLTVFPWRSAKIMKVRNG